MNHQDLSASLEEFKTAVLIVSTSKYHIRRLKELTRRGESLPMNILAGGKFGTEALGHYTSAGGDPSYAYAIVGEQLHRRNNPDLRNFG